MITAPEHFLSQASKIRSYASPLDWAASQLHISEERLCINMQKQIALIN